MSQPPRNSCVGILYCGDLGAALGRLLRQTGVRVVTTCEGRSLRTKQRAESADVELLPTLDDVIRVADVLISVVLPEAAGTKMSSSRPRYDRHKNPSAVETSRNPRRRLRF